VSATYADLYKSPTGPGKGIRKRFLHRTFFGVTLESPFISGLRWKSQLRTGFRPGCYHEDVAGFEDGDDVQAEAAQFEADA
jgi:hypothetical protein